MTDNLPVPQPLRRWFDEENAKSTEALLETIANGFRVELTIIAQRAVQIRILHARGINSAQIKNSVMRILFPHLLRVGYGQLVAEALAAYAGNTALLNALAKLPPPLQLELVATSKVKLLVLEGQEITHRLADVDTLSPKQIKQVFSDDGVRDETQQFAHLEQQRTDANVKARKRTDRFGPLEVDRELSSMRAFTKGNVTREEIKAAMKAVGWL
jgi:hypothetical protein